MAILSPSYPWYAHVRDDSLEQGDFFFDCPVLTPVLPNNISVDGARTLQAVVNEYDVVILSQSCDLVAEKLENVLVCPVAPLEVAAESYSMLRNLKEREAVRRGNVPGLYMIAGWLANRHTALQVDRVRIDCRRGSWIFLNLSTAFPVMR